RNQAMTRSARGHRDDSGDVANLAPAPKRTEDPTSTRTAAGERRGFSRMWHAFLYDRSVRARLSLLVFIPLLGALAFGGFVFKESIDSTSAASEVERNALIAVDAIN